MFENLNQKLSSVFKKLTSKGLLTEEDINLAMREIRIALLEADVSLIVAKSFIEKVKTKAIGQKIYDSVQPGHMVIKIVQDELTELLGSSHQDIDLKSTPPAVILMLGIQGSGKTTSSAKLAQFLKTKHNKKVLLASLDIYRPAAQKQLETLCINNNFDCTQIIQNQTPQEIATRALIEGKNIGADVVILDTAGRLHIDEELINELNDIQKITNPIEKILVADSLTGQDAVNIAKNFDEKVGITSIILTRLDGDSRGGAALSMKHITGKPIKFVGKGEAINDFDIFYPERIAARILDKGDIVSLVEKIGENIEEEDAKQLQKNMQKGNFNFNDMLKQLKTMKKMGGMGSIMSMVPGLSKISNKLDAMNLDDDLFKRQEAIILSMTKQERHFPKIINASRKKRIAKGSGTNVQNINLLLKQFLQMQKMMKKFSKMDKKGFSGMNLGNLKNMLN